MEWEGLADHIGFVSGHGFSRAVPTLLMRALAPEARLPAIKSGPDTKQKPVVLTRTL
jgi:hypothetical protein